METLFSTPQWQRPPLFIPPTVTKEIMPDYISEEIYWAKYYEDPYYNYEWNDGSLEEKGMSDKMTLLNYEWFFELLLNYLRVTSQGDILALETGFRLPLSFVYNQTTIRKPDLGVVLKNNQVAWNNYDKSYHGICDLCVEALSDSTYKMIERDTVTKFNEYARIGVPEYYILYAHGKPQEFYYLARSGVYEPIPRVAPDIICSTVLPGFQFRISDLQRRPSPEEMSEDKVYRAFMLPLLQAEKHARIQEQEARIKEQEARLFAEAVAQYERDARMQEQEARLLAEAAAQYERDIRMQEQEARLLAEAATQHEREARVVIEERLRQLEAELLRRHP